MVNLSFTHGKSHFGVVLSPLGEVYTLPILCHCFKWTVPKGLFKEQLYSRMLGWGVWYYQGLCRSSMRRGPEVALENTCFGAGVGESTGECGVGYMMTRSMLVHCVGLKCMVLINLLLVCCWLTGAEAWLQGMSAREN